MSLNLFSLKEKLNEWMPGIFHPVKSTSTVQHVQMKNELLGFFFLYITGVKSFTVKYDTYVQAEEISLWKLHHKKTRKLVQPTVFIQRWNVSF